MSTVNKTPRLLAAAKEFNIGKSTLLDALSAKGFAVTDSPAFKLSEEMYDALVTDFASERSAKQRSEQIDLPKGEGRKREEEASARALVKKAAETPKAVEVPKAAEPAVAPPTPPREVAAPPKEEEKPAEKEVEAPAPPPQPVAETPPPPPPPAVEAPKIAGPKIVGKIDLSAAGTGTSAAAGETPQKKTAVKKAVEPVEEHETAPVLPEAVAPPVEKEEKQLKKPAVEVPEVEHISITAPKLGGPNILGKIDLSETGAGGRSKKAAPKKAADLPAADNRKPVAKKTAPRKEPEEEPVATSPVEIPAAVVTPPVAEVPKEVPATTTPTEAEKPEHIEMKAPQLSGPKIIGRIELPAAGDSGEKRSRKRIPLGKRPESGGNNRTGTTGNAGGGSTPQYGRDGRPRTTGGATTIGGRTGAGPGGRPGRPGQPGEVDQKEIQRKIQETQARLAGGRPGRGQKAKYRRDKRDAAAEKRAQDNIGEGNVVQVTEFISVSEFANLLNVSFADVISKCMGLGIMVSINQRLDAEVIELVAGEFGYEVSFINLEQEAQGEEEEMEDDAADMELRAPIVTIMGHVDHGKTSLLDYIREANVVAGEAGGITQHIGAYQVTTKTGHRITFLDTPGHEAFTAMRARGAKVADVAVIVISADDAIMPQTKEAISHAQAANLPMIFALNKIDKDGADPEKIRQQLSAMNILVEEWGGKFQSQEISAKKGIGIDTLLEKIVLETEVLELKANPDRMATGSVIEASLDKGRGYVSTILVQNGTLDQGDTIVCGQYFGRIKAMLNERGQRVTTAGPSAPVQVLGLNGAPQAGEKMKSYEDENEAKELATHRAQILREQGIRARKHLTMEEIGRRIALGNFRELPVIIKGDFDGSVEALSDSLQKLSTPEVAVNVVHKGVGAITESDVLLATASDAIIIGFQVRPSQQAAKLADQEDIEVRFYSIIYDAIDEIKSALEGLLAPSKEKKIVANVEIREVFKIGGIGTIAGCYVLDGKMTRNTRVNLLRDSIVVYNGELSSLKRFKDDVKEVNAGYECGMMIKNYNDLRVGDIIEGYEEVEVKRTL